MHACSHGNQFSIMLQIQDRPSRQSNMNFETTHLDAVLSFCLFIRLNASKAIHYSGLPFVSNSVCRAPMHFSPSRPSFSCTQPISLVTKAIRFSIFSWFFSVPISSL